jgi:very-short-patch-repair endonuclease
MASPIETAFLSALLDLAPRKGIKVHLRYGFRGMDETPEPCQGDCTIEARGTENAEMIVFPQAVVHGYRLDFMVALRASVVIAVDIECDGHEWHERTQQQAAYDRARDRDLLRHGFPTIRYTGSEIHRDPDQCASNAIDVLNGQHDSILVRVHAEAPAYADRLIERVVRDLDAEKAGK